MKGFVDGRFSFNELRDLIFECHSVEATKAAAMDVIRSFISKAYPDLDAQEVVRLGELAFRTIEQELDLDEEAD